MRGGNGVPVLVRLALRAFPAEFRQLFAEEMGEDYREARAACGTTLEAAWLASKTAIDVVLCGLRERGAPAVARGTGRSVRRQEASMLGDGWRDLRYAVRALVRRPGFTAVAVVTLALGIGANTAIFSVVNAVLLRPLEWIDPDGLVVVWSHSAEEPDGRGSMSLPDLRDVGDLSALETMVGYRGMTATVTGGEEPELVAASRSTDGLMTTFRVRPWLGRDLTSADAEPGSALVLVVGYRYWQDRLGGRQDVIGSTLEISDVPFEIVGVAAPGFDFPDGAQLWWPRQLDPLTCGRGCHTLWAIGRLATGSSVETLSAQLATLASTLSETYPETNIIKRLRAARLADDTVADVRLGLWFILGAVSLVLLIACANVANLLLVRGEGRRGEIAVRAALGASRARIVSQVLMESAVLTVGGASLGIVLARLGVALVRAMPAATVPRIESVSLDGRVLLFTLGLAVVVMILFGLSPALRLARGLKAADLVSERRGGTSPGAARSRSLLLAAEVALSVLLLVGAGLLLKSFDSLYRVDMGFEGADLTRFRISLPGSRYDSIDEIVVFYETLEDRLRALPGVVSVGSTYGPPLGFGNITGDAVIEGQPPAEPGTETSASVHPVTTGYFQTMRLRLFRGRMIEASDRARTLPVAVVSRTFAEQNFPNEDALGKRFDVTADFGFGSPTWTIVGVVEDVRRSPESMPVPEIYVPLGQYGPGNLTVTMRAPEGVAPTAVTIRDLVRDLDPGLPVIGLETVSDAMRASVAPTRFYFITMTIFAALAVVLACVGLYGVVAYVVSQRGREIGIRMALGARGEQVIRLVLRQGFAPAAAGVAIGLLLALALGRVAESLLFQVSPRDPVIMTAVVLVLGAVALLATLVPAIRASRVDPANALRIERA